LLRGTLPGSENRFAGPRDVPRSVQLASPLTQVVPANVQDASPDAQGGPHTWKTRGCGSYDRGLCLAQGGSVGPAERVRQSRDRSRASVRSRSRTVRRRSRGRMVRVFVLQNAELCMVEIGLHDRGGTVARLHEAGRRVGRIGLCVLGGTPCMSGEASCMSGEASCRTERPVLCT